MPAKVCSLCGEDFWDRWRNTPDVCGDCLLKALARVCPVCLTLHSVERDPAQLDAFGDVAASRPPVELSVGYVRPPQSARRGVQLKNPYH
jgi:hypothetical protein